ncbi:5-deoxy-glucuronate isomerase [Aquitalea sp. FJL05]|uniref:5-deoxy-glucuronate isomerase n=1 Tax=Aquitalea TaxID=407217 RepID=UPI000F59F068|nr:MULTISPECIES: 5-deoxy-glucuronate isomerase [Aquitalea]RQO76042.1 5-deoxy-glucuronate isomerase [Aquitalea sp. FJL05]
MSLLVKAGKGREIADITPHRAGWQHVGFRALRLDVGEQENWLDAGRECCLVILSGKLAVRAGDQAWDSLGERSSVFDDQAPWAVYVPAGTALTMAALTPAEVALCSAPGQAGREVRLIDPASMQRSVRGKGANTRYVTDILPQTEPADGLLVVEVITPSGHSSSYPPHKHDLDNLPAESALEETYYHRIDPPQGFAFQRVYTDDRSLDESHAVENHDVMMVPRGYHPVCVPYGYQSYYLNVMAGPKRQWSFRNDPQHEWLLQLPD